MFIGSTLFAQLSIAQIQISKANLVGHWKLEAIKNEDGQEVDVKLGESSKEIVLDRISLKSNLFKAKASGRRLSGSWKLQGDHIQLKFKNQEVLYNIIESSKDKLVLQCLELPYMDLTLVYAR